MRMDLDWPGLPLDLLLIYLKNPADSPVRADRQSIGQRNWCVIQLAQECMLA
jgi:hypothetical protein